MTVFLVFVAAVVALYAGCGAVARERRLRRDRAHVARLTRQYRGQQ